MTIETRLMPDDARSALLDLYADAMDPTDESTDQHLLREWFEIACGDHEDITDIVDSPLWREHFANNLAVAAVLGTWLNENKRATETRTGEGA